MPQGSVLGPLIYINDLEANIKSRIKFFADDTMIFSVVHDPTLTASELNHDLDLINKWQRSNHNTLYDELGWKSLSDRWLFKCLRYAAT